MEITVYYQSGSVNRFDTEVYVNKEIFLKEGINYLTEIQLRLDLLETEGLLIDIFWYDGTDNEDIASEYDKDIKIQHTIRRKGKRIRIVSKEEIGDIAKIKTGDELLVWRQGAELINAIKFSGQELLCFSDETTTSINRRAVTIFGYLKAANPDLKDESIAKLMGYTKDAIDAIIIDEMANSDFEQEEIYERNENDNPESEE